MGIGENHALGSKPVDVRRGDFSALRIEAMNVSIAKIITEHINNVGLPIPCLEGCGKNQQEEG